MNLTLQRCLFNVHDADIASIDIDNDKILRLQKNKYSFLYNGVTAFIEVFPNS